MPSFRLRTCDPRPGNFLTRGDNGRWFSEQLFDSPTEAAQARLKLDELFSVRVMRDVDGQPEQLSLEELREANAVQHRFEMEEFRAEEKRRERV